jgi:hypothetical protein
VTSGHKSPLPHRCSGADADNRDQRSARNGVGLGQSGRVDDLKHQLLLARDQLGPDTDRRQLARAAIAGTSIRLAHGAYLATDVWHALNPRGHYLARIAAVTATRRSRSVVSHASAAALWGLPWLNAWPDEVHLTVHPSTANRSRNGVVRHSHALPDEDVVELNGYLVTSLVRTVLDIAATCTFMEAIVVADRALLTDRFSNRPALTCREELHQAWARALPFRAHARTRAVIDAAECRAESPLESVSRVTMRAIGVPRPDIQRSYFDANGKIGDVDFAWEEFGVLGESDGDVKYLQPRFRAGRTADRVVLDEKIREDRLRALPRRVVRWRWVTAIDPAALRKTLAGAGLPTGYRW